MKHSMLGVTEIAVPVVATVESAILCVVRVSYIYIYVNHIHTMHGSRQLQFAEITCVYHFQRLWFELSLSLLGRIKPSSHYQ